MCLAAVGKMDWEETGIENQHKMVIVLQERDDGAWNSGGSEDGEKWRNSGQILRSRWWVLLRDWCRSKGNRGNENNT